MTARVRWHGERAKRTYRNEAAERLLAALKECQKIAREAFGVAYPPASKKGEFPRKRSGTLRREIKIYPTTVAELVRRQLSGGLYYGPRAPYGKILEDYRGRLGLAEIVRRNKAKLVAALKQRRSVGRGE